ncbi:hypothetical protein [Streptomyces sp. NPDC001743]|uniref:hypothetical protein n=1 Tax=Streptomyces sp. NPDC001743 TaxID=3154397 RepID=UPI00332BC2C8
MPARKTRPRRAAATPWHTPRLITGAHAPGHGGLRERDWQPAKRPEEHNSEYAATYDGFDILKQRGWTMVATYLDLKGGVITLTAFDDACMKKIPANEGLLG